MKWFDNFKKIMEKTDKELDRIEHELYMEVLRRQLDPEWFERKE